MKRSLGYGDSTEISYVRTPPRKNGVIQDKNHAGWVTYKGGKKISKIIVGTKYFPEGIKKSEKYKFGIKGRTIKYE